MKVKSYHNFFCRLHLVALLLLSAQITSLAQIANADSLNTRLPRQDLYTFAPTQIIAPAILLGVSVAGICTDAGKNTNLAVQKAFSDIRDGRNGTKIDNYLQYAPIAGYLLMDIPGGYTPHKFREKAGAAAVSAISMAILVNGMKYTIRYPRPEGTKNSFPSGHTATAFMGAELVRMEYGDLIGVAAYLVATSVGVMRIYNDKHWLTDVLAGAGIGFVSAHIGYWLLPYTEKALEAIFPSKNLINVTPTVSCDSRTGTPQLMLVARF